MKNLNKLVLLALAVGTTTTAAPREAKAHQHLINDLYLASTRVKGTDILEKTESLRFGDLDNDGDADMCYAQGNYVRCQTHKEATCWFPNGSIVSTCEFSPELDPALGFAEYTMEAHFPFVVTSKMSYLDSLSLVDVDGDDDLDVCLRGPGGVYCAKNNYDTTSALPTPYPPDFQPSLQPMTTGFADQYGWDQPQYSDTVTFADVDDDGRADICGRGAAGVYCYFSTGSAFAGTLSTNNGEFGNSDPLAGIDWGSNPSYYQTLDFVDVDGDDDLDLCGRGADGIYCAEFDPLLRRFGDSKRWLSGQFEDSSGWGQAPYGTTVQFGDINGDGAADVCGRGGAGIYCGVSYPSAEQFGSASQNQTPGEFALWNGWNAENRYSTIKLVDVDGDGKEDVCGRGASGMACAISNSTFFGGADFDTVDPQWVGNFGDNRGWGVLEQYWGSVQPADVDGATGGFEFCGVGHIGVWCSEN